MTAMIKKILGAGILATALAANASAQLVSASGQNYINRFSVAPAFAGFNGNHEAFIGYRSYMTGINGATKLLTADVNGNIGGNMGYGVQIINEKSGNFSNMFAAVSYAYNVELSSDMNLSFALSPAVVRSAFNLGGIKTYSSAIDPTFANEAGLSGTGFDAGFSLMFNFRDLYFSINAPRLICQDLKFQNGINNYDRTIYGTVSYAIAADNWEFEPIADVIYAMEGGLDWRGSLAIKYNNRAWLCGSYCSQKWVGIGAGFSATNRIAVNYQYELGMSDLAKSCNGTHEVSVGFMISKSNTKRKPTVFVDSEDAPSQAKKDSKKDNELEKKLQEEIKTRDAEIKRLEEMIKQAQKNGTIGSNDTQTNNVPPQQQTNVVDSQTQTPPAQQQQDEEVPNASSWKEKRDMLNVTFAKGSAKLMSSSYPGIDAFVAQMNFSSELLKNEYSTKRLLIKVYTDGAGSAAFNKRLAKERAEAIKAYMVSQKVNPSRIETFGVGGSNSTASDPESRFMANKVECWWSGK